MNAFQLPTPPEQPTPKKPTRIRHQQAQASRQRQQKRHQALALEVSVKLGVNIVIIAAAIAALAKLVPYSLAQNTKLGEIQTEVSAVNGRVDQLRGNLQRYFDPQQARGVMQEQTSRLDPNQRVIVWNQRHSSGSAPSPQVSRSSD